MNKTEYKLRDVVDTFIDYRGKTPPKSEEGVPLITAKIVKNGKLLEPSEFLSESVYKAWMTRGFPRTGDLVLTTEAPLGEVALLKDERVSLGQRIIVIRGKPNIALTAYLKYYFQSSVGQAALQARSSGSTVEGIKAAELRLVEVYLPSLSQQQAVVDVLLTLDDKIDLLHQQNWTQEQMAATLYRQWFIEDFAHSEVSLDQCVLFNPKEKINRDSKYMFYEMKCLSNTHSTVTEGELRSVSSASVFRNYDTLLAKITPCLENGKTGLVMNLNADEIGRGSTEFIVMRAKEQISPYWVYCLARSEPFRSVAIQSMYGTSGRQRVAVDPLKEFMVKTDPVSQNRFHEIAEPLFVKIKSNNNQIVTLTQLRDTLLPKLMSGEVRVNTQTLINHERNSNLFQPA